MTTRRSFVRAALTGSALAGGAACVAAAVERLGARAVPRGDDVQVLPFVGETSRRIGRIYGRGLGGRLVFDLKQLDAEHLVVPNDEFFIRTRRPDGLDSRDPATWTVRLHGLVPSESHVPVAELERKSRPQGVHLLECSGNFRSGGFGLLSAAEWSGVPVMELLADVNVSREATRVLISGFDEHSQRVRGSTAGASWVFTFDELESAGAFLATRMNGERLPEDHGFPVRLIVPGWYGCTCAKWVDQIQLVDDSFPATSQMREFAARTHQSGTPELARDYRPARIDQTAMPIRVERWRRAEDTLYRVVGILWGGDRPVERLSIQLGEDQSYAPVTNLRHTTNQTWSLWTHDWHPPGPGKFPIRLKVDDAGVRTRRLDRGFYARTIELAEA